MSESSSRGTGGAGGEGGGTDGLGWRGGVRRYLMDGRGGVDLAGGIVGALTILFIALYVFDKLTEPWRTIMGGAAFAVAVLSVARLGWNMIGGMRNQDELASGMKRIEAKLDALIVKLEEDRMETNRLLRAILDELTRIRKSS